MKTVKLQLTTIALCAISMAPAFSQGTAFTYQGRLSDNGSPANASYALTVALFDMDTNGVQIGRTITNATTAAINGVLSVALDFGTGPFAGSNVWLQIGVRP